MLTGHDVMILPVHQIDAYLPSQLAHGLMHVPTPYHSPSSATAVTS